MAQNVRHILQSVGLEARARHRPHELSWGEMQRAAVGRAPAHNPRLLLADEPTGNLDSDTAGKMFELFKELNQQGITLVIVTHNLELARQAGRTSSIRDGEIIAQNQANGARYKKARKAELPFALFITER